MKKVAASKTMFDRWGIEKEFLRGEREESLISCDLPLLT